MAQNSKPLPDDVIHQIAVLAKIPSPRQILQFETLLNATVATLSGQASGLRPGQLTADRRIARDIFKFSRELDNRLSRASPRLRLLLTPPWFPGKPVPRSLDELTSAVTNLHDMSLFALNVGAGSKKALRAAFIQLVCQDAERCGGHLTRSKAMHGTLRHALDLLRPYLPKEMETDVSSDTVWRATRAQGKNRTR
jgi:hypothetical protein